MAQIYSADDIARMIKNMTAGQGNPLTRSFVKPATNTEDLKKSLLERFVDGNFGNPLNYIKEVVALNLGLLHAESGVYVSTFTPQPNDDRTGFFTPKRNSITLENGFEKDPTKMINAISTAAHESKHKRQQELNAKAKYFGRYEDFMKVGEDPNFSTICGFAKKDACYYLYRIENEAFARGKEFSFDFLDRAEAMAAMAGKTDRVEFIRQQREQIQETEDRLAFAVESTRESFLKGGVENFVKKASTAFERSFSLAKGLISGRLTAQDKAHATLMSNLPDPYSPNPVLNALYSCGTILSRMPKRQYIEQMVDFAISTNVDQLFGRTCFILTDNAVRLTESDITRMFLSSDYFRGDKSNFKLLPQTVARIDEATWVKNMLLTQGLDVTRSYISNLKQETGLEYPINFTEVDKIVNSFQPKPLLVQPNGYKFYGCAEILSYALDRSVYLGKVKSDEILIAKANASKVLANIMQKFNYDQTNPEFLSALSAFAQDPFRMRYEDQDVVTEYSYAFTRKVSDCIQTYLREGRVVTVEEGPSGGSGSKPGDSPFVRDISGDGEAPGVVKQAKVNFVAQVEHLKSILSQEEFEAFIKGLNLTDSAKLPEEGDLLEVLRDIGLEDVATHLKSDAQIIPTQTAIDRRLSEDGLVVREDDRVVDLDTSSDVATEYGSVATDTVSLIDGTKVAASAKAIVKINNLTVQPVVETEASIVAPEITLG